MEASKNSCRFCCGVLYPRFGKRGRVWQIKRDFLQTVLADGILYHHRKGYSLVNGKGELLPAVAADFAAGPEKPASYIGKVASLLYTRFKNGQLPIAMVSMDNCSHNGDKLYAAIHTFAEKWAENGLAEKEFVSYVNDREKVSFPWSMIDKITPRPDASVEEILKKDEIDGLDPVVTSKNTYVAPFVNAEECEYLVIEDWFPNGRPELEKGGIMFTDRATVDKVEK